VFSEDELTGVLAAPDDDAPRLALAERLTARGDPRGLFIQAQCALHQLPTGHPDREERLVEAHRLRLGFELQWTAALRGLGVDTWRFERGCLEWASLDAEDYLGLGDRLFRAAPSLRAVRLLRTSFARAQRVAQAAPSAHLDGLELVSASSEPVGDRGAKALGSSPHLSALTRLDLKGCRLGPQGCRALIANKRWTLRALTLSENPIERAGAVHLSRWSGLKGLRRLALARCRLDDQAVKVLLEKGRLTAIESLDLSGNRLGEPGIKRIVGAALPALKQLSVAESPQLDTHRAAGLASNPSLGALEEISLAGSPIGLAGAAAILGSPMLGSLKRADLREIGLPGQTGRRKATVLVPPALAELAEARNIELILS
jgi:uncharacterized protein (TIGR02996 family)